jgi:hypothetical protein
MTRMLPLRAEVWTAEAIRGSGHDHRCADRGAIIGIGRTKAYQLAKEGAFPVTVLRIGRR